MEVEKVVEIVSRSCVGKTQIAEAKDTLDSFHDAAKIVFQVADIPSLGRVGRNHDQRYTKAELIVILVRPSLEHGPHVVIPTSPIVPGNESVSYTHLTTDGLALDTISVSREFERDEDEARRAARIGNAIEQAVRGELKLPDVVAKRAAPKGRLKAFAIEPEVTINNQWSARYTVVEVTGLDRPGLLYELTATLSKLCLLYTSRCV